ncbi:MAG: HTH domain-containing protein [Defluviitaleaceae bacterium]|nr:HTH domain-containing protein [Defluviitaleaceae bacterium]
MSKSGIDDLIKILESIDKKLDTLIEMQNQKPANMRTVINAMSYTEISAVSLMLKLLTNGEGILVSGKVAEELGITRSVVVNAIRKLESAGVVESRSLGMKGTFIKVLNNDLFTEFAKL